MWWSETVFEENTQKDRVITDEGTFENGIRYVRWVSRIYRDNTCIEFRGLCLTIDEALVESEKSLECQSE